MWTLQSNNTLADGEWIVQAGLSDSQLAAFYLDMEVSGNLPIVFHAAAPDIRWFLDWLTAPNATTMSAWWQHPTSDVPPILAGIGFVNDCRVMDGLTKAEVGFAFTERMGVKTNFFRKVQLIQGMISGVFTFTQIEAIHGVTPEPNAAAVALARRAGMRIVGPVSNYTTWQGRPCGVYFSQADREYWFNKYQVVG